MFEIKKVQSFNKTIRMPEDLIDKLEILANKNEISFNQLVVQCCEYALENLGDNNKNKKQWIKFHKYFQIYLGKI